jgi:hypothetical protein
MNRELNTLFWYTRSELVTIRRRNKSFLSDRSDQNVKSDDSEASLRDEVDVIIRSMIETIDEILASESKLWNTPFLIHIIQAFSVHIFNLNTVQETNSSLLYTLLPLDIDYTRLRCYNEIILGMCQANLISLCTGMGNGAGSGVGSGGSSGGSNGGSSGGGSSVSSGGGNGDDVFRTTCSYDSITSKRKIDIRNIPCLSRTHSGKRMIITDDMNKSTPNSPNKDKSVTFPPPLRKALSYTHITRTPHIESVLVDTLPKESNRDKQFVDKTPSHEVMRWRAAQQAIRWVVSTPDEIGSRLHNTKIQCSKVF